MAGICRDRPGRAAAAAPDSDQLEAPGTGPTGPTGSGRPVAAGWRGPSKRGGTRRGAASGLGSNIIFKIQTDPNQAWKIRVTLEE